MKRDDAKKNNLGWGGLNGETAKSNFSSNYNSLKNRPDYDGFVTASEGIEWAKSHPAGLANPTPENSLYINTAKLDVGYTTAGDLPSENKGTPVNLLNFDNSGEAGLNKTLFSTIYGLGRVNMILTSREKSTVTIVNEGINLSLTT